MLYSHEKSYLLAARHSTEQAKELHKCQKGTRMLDRSRHKRNDGERNRASSPRPDSSSHPARDRALRFSPNRDQWASSSQQPDQPTSHGTRSNSEGRPEQRTQIHGSPEKRRGKYIKKLMKWMGCLNPKVEEGHDSVSRQNDIQIYNLHDISYRVDDLIKNFKECENTGEKRKTLEGVANKLLGDLHYYQHVQSQMEKRNLADEMNNVIQVAEKIMWIKKEIGKTSQDRYQEFMDSIIKYKVNREPSDKQKRLLEFVGDIGNIMEDDKLNGWRQKIVYDILMSLYKNDEEVLKQYSKEEQKENKEWLKNKYSAWEKEKGYKNWQMREQEGIYMEGHGLRDNGKQIQTSSSHPEEPRFSHMDTSASTSSSKQPEQPISHSESSNLEHRHGDHEIQKIYEKHESLLKDWENIEKNLEKDPLKEDLNAVHKRTCELRDIVIRQATLFPSNEQEIRHLNQMQKELFNIKEELEKKIRKLERSQR